MLVKAVPLARPADPARSLPFHAHKTCGSSGRSAGSALGNDLRALLEPPNSRPRPDGHLQARRSRVVARRPPNLPFCLPGPHRQSWIESAGAQPPETSDRSPDENYPSGAQPIRGTGSPNCVLHGRWSAWGQSGGQFSQALEPLAATRYGAVWCRSARGALAAGEAGLPALVFAGRQGRKRSPQDRAWPATSTAARLRVFRTHLPPAAACPTERFPTGDAEERFGSARARLVCS